MKYCTITKNKERLKPRLQNSSGFTLLEILIIIAIIVILAGISVQVFSNIYSAESVNRDASAVASLLETARVHTLSSKENDQYGVHIDGSDIMMFKGDSYSPAGVQATESLRPDVGFKAINIAGSNSTIIFERLTGATNNHGTLVLESNRDYSTSTITIEPTGTITTTY